MSKISEHYTSQSDAESAWNAEDGKQTNGE